MLGLVLSGVFGLLVDLLGRDGFRFFCAIFLMIRDSSSTLLTTCSTRLPCDRHAAPLPCKIPDVCLSAPGCCVARLTQGLSLSGGRHGPPVHRGCPCRDPRRRNHIQGNVTTKRQPFACWLESCCSVMVVFVVVVVRNAFVCN